MANRPLVVIVLALMACGSVAGRARRAGARYGGGSGASEISRDQAIATAEPTAIDSCTVTTEPGRYELAGGIENYDSVQDDIGNSNSE